MIQKIASKLKRASDLKKYLLNEENNLNFYSLLYTATDDQGFAKHTIKELNTTVTLAFTSKEKALEFLPDQAIIPIMLGKLIQESCSEDTIEVIATNPVNVEGLTKFENLVFVPFYDKLTKQYLISPSDDSIALLAIDSIAHKHMGVQATFFSVTHKSLSDDSEVRSEELSSIVEDISFILPRISQPRGSANLIVLLLNLENSLEERSFIRKYQTFEDYIQVLFVTSDLKLQNGSLEEIEYNGCNLEGVYTPIIRKYSNK